SEYVGRMRPSEVPAELVGADVMLQAARYEPFGLTVAEALACGVPVVATSEVGAIEGVERSVVAEVAPGDAGAMADELERLLAALGAQAPLLRATARREAERLFATGRVCGQISRELQALVHGVGS